MLFAMMALAFGNYPIYYSSELKQSSTDVFVALLLLLLIEEHLRKQTNLRDFLKLGIFGILAICFSHPAIFILSVIGPILVLHYWNDKHKLWWTLLTGTGWVLIFLALYLLLLRHQTSIPDYILGRPSIVYATAALEKSSMVSRGMGTSAYKRCRVFRIRDLFIIPDLPSRHRIVIEGRKVAMGCDSGASDRG
jgi:hypothetical protein